tara:strand:- start:1700 stop:2008 length:309 start_codon:yes stop_codon:yes gene_type:complete
MRFNVGDRIKNISTDYGNIKIGDTAIIESYSHIDDDYKLQGIPSRWLLELAEWELVEPKVATTFPKATKKETFEIELKDCVIYDITREEAEQLRDQLNEVLK